MKYLAATILFLNISLSFAQTRDYKIHSRSMLHETVFNTGEIGRAWMYGSAGEKTGVPLMEWPPNSGTSFGTTEYSGQENSIGAGLYISANLLGKPGTPNRLYSFCGGIGSSNPEVTLGNWSFPLSLIRTENYPVSADGTLNSLNNPDEAEEIITSKWATNIGITVTRTSRAWSYPATSSGGAR